MPSGRLVNSEINLFASFQVPPLRPARPTSHK